MNTAERHRPKVLPRRFYARPTLEVARDLLGKVLVHRTAEGVTAGAIVEAEAYIGESDPACHAASGPTRRNAPLYGPPGHAYVYFNYGMHWLVNAVTEPAGSPAAVLIRALDPLEGIELMRRRRGHRRDGRSLSVHELCRGPGNVTKAMGIGTERNDVRLVRAGGLWIEDRGVLVDDVTWTPRIGISVGTGPRWRAIVTRHPAVSGGRRVAALSPAGAVRGAERARGTPLSARRGTRQS